MVQILWDLRSKCMSLGDLVSGNTLNLSNTVRITKDDTDLGRGQSLLRTMWVECFCRVDLRLEIPFPRLCIPPILAAEGCFH
ncbi:hypothetical protein Leryth_001523 [Lithospermum erythrorhizon]|nr:hypothetical protein Leryth_001523 [Lithospermum erythrorhizon]